MFHVFVEGAKDASPAGLARLAEAIAAHYGLAPADITARLQSGRFRAKGNCDRATAEQYARDLDRLGARCVIEAANAENSRPTPLPFAAAQPPRPATSSLPPATTPPARPSPPGPLGAGGAPPARPSSPPGQFASGLSAAFSGEAPAADLGALEQLESGGLALASVDGSEGSGPVAQPGSFVPPAGAASASIGPPPEQKPGKPAQAAKPTRPKDEPLDLFVPPDLASDDLKVELADDRPARASAPDIRAAPPAAAPGAPEAAAPAAAPAAAARRAHPLSDARTRLVAGVLLAIVLGFVPAHLIAHVREKSAFAAIDHKVETLEQQVDTQEAYDQLDTARAELLDEKYGDRRSIAVMAFLIWAAAAGGIAYVWFRRVPWERFES